ncbi:AMP-binding protein, partial [Rhodococcus sp. CX]|uniref:AMP-binding protein n=1 Tax=Rhodococcus sp. CX TaxID=2789880 RepID=UPI0018CFCFA3
ETRYILDDAGVDVVLCDAEHAEIAARAAEGTGVRLIVAWGDGDLPTDVRSWARWCAEAGDAEPRTDLEPRRTLVYTSGTTGRPKGVELPYTSWVGGEDITEHVARLGGSRMIPFGRHLVVGPMYHSGPLAATRLFIGGAPVTVLGKYDATEVLAAIERDRIGSTIMVPTHLQRLLDLPQEVRNRFDHSSLKYVLQVGAKCPESVKRAMIAWWGPVVWESYGASEVGTTCMISSEEWLRHPGSVGRSVAPFEAFVRLSDGSEAPPGTEGELWFRDTSGHGITYVSGAGTDETFTLGEIGVINEDGYVWITDRAADMVVSGGVNIYPAEVEQALLDHPQVSDVACYGVPDPEMGERLVAVVVASGSERPVVEQLRSFCRERLAGYKCPKEFLFADELPRTAVGKLDKRAIRCAYDPPPARVDARGTARTS